MALLDLSRNQLGTISRETLQPLASLQVLRLTGNFLGARGSHAKAAPLARVVALRSQPAVERDPVAALGGGGGGAALPIHSHDRKLLGTRVESSLPKGDRTCTRP